MQSLNDLLIENQPVTVKLLSRKLEIKVTKAKQIMLEFHIKNPEISALFLVRHDNKIKLLSKQELEGDDYEIYSIQANRDQLPLKIKDDANTLKVCRARVNKNILISLEKSKSVPQVSVPAPRPAMKKSNSDQHVKKEVKKATFFSRFKKNENEKEEPRGIPVKVVKINKKVEIKDDDMEVSEASDNTEKKVDLAEKKAPKEEKMHPKPEKIKQNKESKAQQHQLEQMFDDEPEQPKRDSTTEIKRIRKKRKIIRSETFMDGKYMKTRDVEDWESYDDEMEVVAPVEKNKEVIPLSEKPKKKGKGQMTLTSFFKKK
ncbi:hypothetical protein HDV01_002494 [Terramyces sp. JEL0728]|nr:hypothetical protein HDV01_002494 [Terramyces sp. JEL0728]